MFQLLLRSLWPFSELNDGQEVRHRSSSPSVQDSSQRCVVYGVQHSSWTQACPMVRLEQGCPALAT